MRCWRTETATEDNGVHEELEPDTRNPLLAIHTMVFAQFERSMLVARTHAGLARARAAGKKLGRPSLPLGVRNAALDVLRAGGSLNRAMAISGASMGAVSRLRQELKQVAHG